ncbi:putative glycosidase crf2 [Cladophialophora carrionii]|uniref:Crh-like protein n=1 Tax=Cladophialophora carrionii TaxID=86049 RepID=A0A1C1CNM4_9EURO|nr:putative glycosidase crf2 [Cladophialophora carrionii]
MAGPILHSLLFLAALAPSVLAQVKCGGGVKCPSDTPCCSQYGQCGVGAYCLGGCDPVNSFGLDSCVPAPVCKSKKYEFSNLDGIVPNTKYLGDPTTADWVSSGSPLEYQDSVLLTMAEGTVGTLLTSTRHVWYGKVGARFATSAGAGVVTAFILLGNSKDEIDFEFVGVELENAQTNFYSQGVPVYTNGGNTTGLSDVHANMHDYEIDWQPDSITWSIDGKVVRTLDREDTWNATANRYYYPQTPCQVQLSLWPGGLPTNGEGTIEWAGGLVEWDSPYMTNGYYFAQFDSVSVECYDPPSGANVQGSKSYIFTDPSMTNLSVEVTNDNTVLKSFLGTGTNMSANYPSNTASSSGSSKTSEVATIPGLSGGGTGSNGDRGDNSSGSNSDSDGGSGSDSGATASASGAASTGFVQGDGGDGSSNGAGSIGGNGESLLKGSLFAAIVAVVGLCIM